MDLGHVGHKWWSCEGQADRYQCVDASDPPKHRQSPTNPTYVTSLVVMYSHLFALMASCVACTTSFKQFLRRIGAGLCGASP